ncbi:MAG: tetratricopeptide repeat protein, partial [Sciscionella sp.]|nr:tetratricopeptide repeat protein [Sciscionella sp.]
MCDTEFAADLERLWLDTGLSLRALGKSCGIPRSTLSDALGGRCAPSLETVLAIVRACGAEEEQWRHRWADMRRRKRQSPLPATGSAAAEATSKHAPAQLPLDVPGFTGRTAEFDALDATRLAVIHGGPGVGKSALAVRWAHRATPRFPDGQLYLDLRGHHPTLPAMTPQEILGRLLGSMGTAWAPHTADIDDGARLWRSTVSGKRLLIVLDDAISAEQVRPVLPGSAGAVLVVTSRRRLSELTVSDGAHGVPLDVLPSANSLEVLGQVTSAARVAAEPVAALAVADACGHLPLALRMAGAAIDGSPSGGFAGLADVLTSGSRLSALEALAGPSVVENAFDASYRTLPPPAQFVFRRLGLLPGNDIGADTTAILTELPRCEVDRLLGTLADAHLIEPVGRGRYRMHDLLRDYAVRLAERAESDCQSQRLRRRLLSWYVGRAHVLSCRLGSAGEVIWVDEPARSWEPTDWEPTDWEPTDAEAAGWLELEERNIIAAIEHDACYGSGRYAWTLVDLLADVLLRRNDVSDLIHATHVALAAAQRHGEPRAEARLRTNRGWLRWRNADAAGVIEDFTEALALFGEVDDHRGKIMALRGLAACHIHAGRIEQARGCVTDALSACRARDDDRGAANALNSLAIIAIQSAEFAAAERYFRESIAMHKAAGNRSNAAVGLANLSYVHVVMGKLDTAMAVAEEAVELAKRIGDGFAETVGLVNGALACDEAGLPHRAQRLATAAYDRVRPIGHKLFEVMVADTLATTSRRAAPGIAGSYRQRATRSAREANDVTAEAEVLLGVARDAYAAAVESAGSHAFHDARAQIETAYHAARQCHDVHAVGQALGLLAACDLAQDKVVDAISEAREAVDMHVTSGARPAEVRARCVLGHALA